MEKKTLFLISSWGTIIISIFVILDAFNPYILVYGDFYLYLILIAGIIGIIGAIISLGIFPVIGGFIICGSLLYSSVIYGISVPILSSFGKAILLLIGGCGIILTFEDSREINSFELPLLGLNKTEYFALRNVGITNLTELIAEKGNEKEICAITTISLSQLKSWIQKAEKILTENEEMKKAQLKKDFKDKYKK